MAEEITTTTNPSWISNKIFKEAQGNLLDVYKNTPDLFPKSAVAGFTPTQQQAQTYATNVAAPQQQAIANTAANQYNFLSNDAMYAESNPYLRSYMDAAIRPIVQNYQENTLPGIDQRTSMSAPSSREGIAQGIAQRGMLDAIGSTAANIANTGYQSGLDANLKALALAPQTQGAMTAPASTLAGVGDAQQALAQAQLSEEEQKFLMQEFLPYLLSREGVQLAMSGNLGSTSTSYPGVEDSGGGLMGGLGGALGGAGGGAALGTMVMPGLGTAVGAGLGGLFGGLGGSGLFG